MFNAINVKVIFFDKILETSGQGDCHFLPTWFIT